MSWDAFAAASGGAFVLAWTICVWLEPWRKLSSKPAQAPERTAEPMVSVYRSLPPHPAEVELRELRARLREMGGEE